MHKLTETEANSGKYSIYAICNGDGKFICDILEDDYIHLLDEGVVTDGEGEDGVRYESEYSIRRTLSRDEADAFKAAYGVIVVPDAEANQALDTYHEFMNENVLKQINCDYHDLLRRGLAVPAPSV